jgi:hypothetical protein
MGKDKKMWEKQQEATSVKLQAASGLDSGAVRYSLFAVHTHN